MGNAVSKLGEGLRTGESAGGADEKGDLVAVQKRAQVTGRLGTERLPNRFGEGSREDSACAEIRGSGRHVPRRIRS